MNEQESFRIVLSGGGTMGSVSPLIAVYQELKKKDSRWEAIWIGTTDGPEKPVIEGLGIKFYAVKNGKFRRYLSFQNFIDPFKIFWGIHQSKKLLKEFKPQLILTAGSFVCYPVSRAAKKLNIPYFLHQQDIEKGLANKMMEKNAAIITISFDVSLNDFDIKKTYYTSNPARLDRLQCDKSKAVEMFKLDPNRPTILVTGGGIGAQAVNQLTLEALGMMTEKAQVVHLTGKGKSIEALIPDYHDRAAQIQIRQHYRHYEFLDKGMCEILNYADLVISRAGISSLTELSLLQKPTVLIPIPDSHQEKNAKYFGRYNAVKLIDQKTITGPELGKIVVELINNPAELSFYSKNIAQMIAPDASKKYVDLIYKYLQI